jgi:hypothetical protein
MTEQDIIDLEMPRIVIDEVFTLFKLTSAGGEKKREISHAIVKSVAAKIRKTHDLLEATISGKTTYAKKEWYQEELFKHGEAHNRLCQEVEGHAQAALMLEGFILEAEKTIAELRTALEVKGGVIE